MRPGVFMAEDGFARLRRRIAEIEGRSADFVRLTEGTDPGLPPHPTDLSSLPLAKVGGPLPPRERGTAFVSGTNLSSPRSPLPDEKPTTLSSARPPLPWWERAVSLGEPPASLEKRGEGARTTLLPFAIPKLDRILGGGLRQAALHEIRSGESRDAAAATGFAVGVLAGLLPNKLPILWILESAAAYEAGFPHGSGLGNFGLSPSRLIVVRVTKPGDALWVFEEGLRCRGLSAVVTEIRGNPRQLDLTASRRLALRAREHGVMGLLLRQTARIEPGAAATRWLVAPRPAAATDDYPAGIGNPAWRLTLERNRFGTTGIFDVEWNHERGSFAESATAKPAHSLPVAAVSSDRPPVPADTGQDMALDRAS